MRATQVDRTTARSFGITIGYSGAKVREEYVDIYYDGVIAVKSGTASKTPAAKLQELVAAPGFKVTIDLNVGPGEYTVYTTDLSVDYVKLNMGE